MLREEVVKEKEALSHIRRFLHENPEVGFDLPDTAKFVSETLKTYGYETRKLQ